MKISCIVAIFLFATVFASSESKASPEHGRQYRSVHRLKRDADHSLSYGGSPHHTHGSHVNSGVGHSIGQGISNGYVAPQVHNKGFSGRPGLHKRYNIQQGFNNGFVNVGHTVHNSGFGHGGPIVPSNYVSGYRYKK
nr:uncharacterized protein LOC121116274 [Lepeophtheirus salmonis]